MHDLMSLKPVEVYEFYDRALLFSCKNPGGQLFLALLADEKDGVESWLFAPISPDRFKHIRSGGIDLHDAFAKAETGTVFLVLQNAANEVVRDIQPVSCNSLREDWLPMPGEFIDWEMPTSGGGT